MGAQVHPILQGVPIMMVDRWQVELHSYLFDLCIHSDSDLLLTGPFGSSGVSHKRPASSLCVSSIEGAAEARNINRTIEEWSSKSTIEH